jgi:hypothetical protein
MQLSKEVLEIGKMFSFDKKTTTKLLLEVDGLTLEELSDLEYVEDRLETHSTFQEPKLNPEMNKSTIHSAF